MCKKMYYIASCSCGKDSLAMVYRLIEENKPLNEIVFYDTEMEFEAIYNNWDKLKHYAESKGIKHTTLYPKCSFLYTMLEKVVNKGKPNEHKGYSWCGGCCRWGTTEKLKALDRYCEERNAICYVGIAADEPKRLEKERKSYKIFPLADWGMTENECLEYCRNIGLDWKEKSCNDIDLYDILDRVSCWCCANKNLWELYNYWKKLPTYWNKLKILQFLIARPFKKGYSIFGLEKRFEEGYIPKNRKNIK
ncbi:MAG TPA: phosphoadenosine phosphosulfate reductase family protein [Candidatus Pelethenecus sp.]|nr:phosphoadenosine phosphosulfate reductase family protein [Candidatus Pelethenecus sp.]